MPSNRKSARYIVSADGKEALLAQQLNRVINDVDNRLNDLEHKENKTGKKPDISRAEKSAILFELGVMTYLSSLPIPQKKIAHLLSMVMNASEANIEKDLSSRNEINANFKNEATYKFVVAKFKELGIKDNLVSAQKTLTKIEEAKGK